ncbi:MAG: RecQ family ATP-dependent DNA helicase [Chitinophagaceae bacterium]
MTEQPLDVLQKYWQYASFRPVQLAAIEAVLAGKDVLALMPTGGGKSLCYQIPGLILDGICLVVSPLIALMKDQVDGLQKRGIAAVALHSGLTQYELQITLSRLRKGHIKFVYLSPERLQSALFQHYLPELPIKMVAIDEAHCISQWGYDFRPAYLQIALLKKQLPGIPFIALTASATPTVQTDIIDKIPLEKPIIVKQSFERSNLSFSVHLTEVKIKKLIQIFTNVAGAGIVYCNNRRETQYVAQLLQSHGFLATYYHAGLSTTQRNEIQAAWIANKYRIIVCTNAFGMGIDKPDVRVVVHYHIPDNLENYYQEAGRAGRDGKKSYAAVLYNKKDLSDLEELPNQRFPAINYLQEIYQHIAHYLQIPVGIGAGNYYNFNFTHFTETFKLKPLQAMNAIKMLEKEGHFTFNERIFLPTSIQFTATREDIEYIENTHPTLEPVIKGLLRTYEGIFNNSVSVFEKQLAKIVGISIPDLEKKLQQLQQFGIISINQLKETPQLYFLLNRAPANYAWINEKEYANKKEAYIKKINKITAYLSINTCRSKYLANYFGDTSTPECGICDNCINKRKKANNNLYDMVLTKLKEIASDQPVTAAVVLVHLRGFAVAEIWEILYFLAEKKVISISADNQIQLINK